MNQAQAATDKATTQIQSGLHKVDSAFKSIAKAAATYISVRTLVSFGKQCVELGSDLTEVQNVVDTTFGKMSSKIDEFSKSAIKQFGLSETAAKRYSSTMGAMLKSMGMSTDQAYDMSTTLAGLAGDIASFYNLSADEAFAKLRSGISGETEPLKQLGINLSVANLQAYALSQGITKSYNSMTQAEQALLRYNYLLTATADAQGDFSRTADSWANQVKILQMNFQSLKATIGQGLIYALTPVIKMINTLMEHLQRLAEKFKLVMAIITGQDLNEVFGTGTSGAEASANLAADMGSVSVDADATSDSVDAIAEGMGDAAKEAKKFLLSFDEIHKLESGSDDGINVDLNDLNTTEIDSLISDEAVSGIDEAAGSVDEFNNSLGMSNEEIAALKEKLQPVIDFLTWIKDGIVAVVDEAKRIWDEVAPEIIAVWQNDIEPNLTRWGELISDLWENHLKSFFESVGAAISALWHNILEPFLKWFAEQGFDKVINTIEDLSDTGGGILGIVTGLFNTAVGDAKLFAADVFGWGDADEAQLQIEQGQYQMAKGAHQTLQGTGNFVAGTMDTLGITEDARKKFNDVMQNTTPWLVDTDAYNYFNRRFGNGEDKKSLQDYYETEMLPYFNGAPELPDSSENMAELEAIEGLRDSVADLKEYAEVNSGINAYHGSVDTPSTFDNNPIVAAPTIEDYKDACKEGIREALDERQPTNITIEMSGREVGYGVADAMAVESVQFNPEVAVV